MNQIKKADVGVIHGRFQILHNEHLKYLLAGKERCEHLIVGITNPDPFLTKYTASDPDRSQSASNPLTYFERYEIIKGSLLEAGVERDEFDIVPFPINVPAIIFHYVPRTAVYYMTIYDEWGEEKRRLLEQMGCQVEVMWKKCNSEKTLCATDIRKKIIKGLQWEHLVPKYVYQYIITHGIDKRIQEKSAQG